MSLPVPVDAAAPDGGPLPPGQVGAREWRLLAVLAAACLLWNLPFRLEDGRQARQAFSALEMAQGGQWGFQHTPGGRLPAGTLPLTGWSAAAAYGISGNWELAWRLPGLLAAAGLLALLWRAGEKLWPGAGGRVAAAAFGLNLFTPRLALWVGSDSLLALWTTLAGLAVWRQARDGEKPWTPPARWALFGVLLAAVFTQGPEVYALLLPGMVALTWVMHRRGSQWGAVWGGWWPWAVPLVAFGVWVERGMVTVPGFYQQVVLREYLGRTAPGGASEWTCEPVYFYFLEFVLRWAPWSLLLLAARLWARRAWRTLLREPGTLWLACWTAGGLVMLSLLPDKRLDRLCPVIPPACLLLTALLARARQSEGGNGPEAAWPLAWTWRTAGAAAALAVLAGASNLVQTYRRHEDAPEKFGTQVRALTAGKRLELVAGRAGVAGEDAMIVYLRRMRFLSPGEAVQPTGAERVEAVVISERNLEAARGVLEPFEPGRPALVSEGEGPRWLLMMRPRALPPIAPAVPGHRHVSRGQK